MTCRKCWLSPPLPNLALSAAHDPVRRLRWHSRWRPPGCDGGSTYCRAGLPRSKRRLHATQVTVEESMPRRWYAPLARGSLNSERSPTFTCGRITSMLSTYTAALDTTLSAASIVRL
jgi:hypothetical protein